MVLFYRPSDARYVVYAGRDKVENEDLIRWGLPTDWWFHVDKMSSAHVYIRLPRGEGIQDVPDAVIQECCQLVKANSIQGCKEARVKVVFTPWENLKKTSDMAVGQVGFHSQKKVTTFTVEGKDNAVLNRLEKTKVEEFPDLQRLREKYDATLRQEAKEKAKRAEADAKRDRAERDRQRELRQYTSVMVKDAMHSNAENHGRSAAEVEEDFM